MYRIRCYEFSEHYTSFLLLFFLFLGTLIFTDFFLDISVSRWTLPVAFTGYIGLWLIYFAISHASRPQFLKLGITTVLSLLVFTFGTALFAHTYDTSYDGQYYHETAVMAFAQGWNPIHHPNLPLPVPSSGTAAFDEGAPKVLWAIDGSIYAFTHSMNSVTVLNLLIAFLAFIFVLRTLKILGIDTKWAIVISSLTVCTTIFSEQLFSLREDSVSYDFMAIAICCLILVRRQPRQYLYILYFVTCIILLAGSKLSNDYVCLALVVIAAYVIAKTKLYRQRSSRAIATFGVVAAFVMLSNPYFTNIFHYHALDYPYNQPVFAQSFRESGVPANIRNGSRLKLFYYGIFSSAEISNANNPAAYARLKIPFSLSANDMINVASENANLVGGYGVWFSGIFVLSLAAYLYLLITKRSKLEKSILRWLSLLIIIVFITCLLIPIPNYARYNTQLTLLPIAVIVVLLIWPSHRKRTRILASLLAFCMFINIYFDIIPAAALREGAFDGLHDQLTSLRLPNTTYLVHASLFYPDYVTLESAGVKIRISAHSVTCHSPTVLDFSRGTTLLCPITTK
jgi:hypothetical protein